MRENSVLSRLRAGQPSYGLWLTIGSTVIAEDFAQAGLDWVLIDNQHGYWSHDALLATIQVVSHTPTLPIARAGWNDPALIGRLLDAGALGVVVPMVNSRADAERAVEAVRYPPLGKRSAGGSRLLDYDPDYFTTANPAIMLAVMIETVQAVERADEILSTPGVDCCFVGPGDLALDLGTYGQPGHPRHEEALQTVLAAGKKNGVPLGIACGSADVALQRVAQGFQFVDIGSDIGFIREGQRAARRKVQTGRPTE